MVDEFERRFDYVYTASIQKWIFQLAPSPGVRGAAYALFNGHRSAFYPAAGGPRALVPVSATTRRKRPGEVDGRDYHFVDRARFEAMNTQHVEDEIERRVQTRQQPVAQR